MVGEKMTNYAAKRAEAPCGVVWFLAEFLRASAGPLWKDWPMEMRCTALDANSRQFSLNGECPHCRRAAVFMIVAGPHAEGVGAHQWRLCAAMQCQGCLKYILGIVLQQSGPWNYIEHYPLGKPDDRVAEEIPPNIAADFREALRCRWVDAYNATVEMCRRAVEASCIEQKADAGLKLDKKIEWLLSQGIITKPLKEMADKIRLGGNRGAHPPDDPNNPGIVMNAEYADAVVEFTKDYFHHVYVMTKRLAKFDFSKSVRSQKENPCFPLLTPTI